MKKGLEPFTELDGYFLQNRIPAKENLEGPICHQRRLAYLMKEKSGISHKIYSQPINIQNITSKPVLSLSHNHLFSHILHKY